MIQRKKIKRLLVANRGEIALRIIRATKEMGITAIALYSEDDRDSPYVFYADEAYPLSGSSLADTYLSIEKILEISQYQKVDAIHPGYGFLSENADFAQAVEKEGLCFIGPGSSSIKSIGHKTSARELVSRIGIPIVPGTIEPLKSSIEGQEIALRIGYPVLLKAAGGGGGKGMRTISSEGEFKSAFERAQGEAEKAFGDSRIYLEKLIQNPKHIEIQIAADNYGNIVHFGERDCSVQRRHQKVIEECPSTSLTKELRSQMGESAIRIVKACGYVNLGTVEFLLDLERNYYFLEMNTRLQVEHPVTELVYNIDLVKLQISIAEGQEISLRQGDIRPLGHAIECRIYAEDPFNNFFPSIGTLTEYMPAEGPGIRNDSGVMRGQKISTKYDPLLAKLICYDADRNAAIERTKRALKEYLVEGVETTIPFCYEAISSDLYRQGTYSIEFVSRHFDNALLSHGSENKELAAMIIAAHVAEQERNKRTREVVSNTSKKGEINPWKRQKFESLR